MVLHGEDVKWPVFYVRRLSIWPAILQGSNSLFPLRNNQSVCSYHFGRLQMRYRKFVDDHEVVR